MLIDKLIALLYLIGAIFVLTIGDFGVLTIPGVIVAVFGVIAMCQKCYLAAGLSSTLAAITSFIAQSFTGWCISCTIAAAMFAIAGLLSYGKKLKLLLGIPALLLISYFILSSTLSVNEVRTANRYENNFSVSLPLDSHTNALAEPGKGENKQIPLLYVSAYCPSCKEVLKRYIENDPQGDHWQPVMVSPGQVGISMLTDMGYTGKVYQSGSALQAVPCLKFGDEKYIGEKNILSAFVTGEISKR